MSNPQYGRNTLVGSSFLSEPEASRSLDIGMGVAVGRRTVFRPEDNEDFGKVADRVAEGNMGLLGDNLTEIQEDEKVRLRNAIASGALLTSGRHLQHGDYTQSSRNMEVYSNCSSAITSFAKFYLLLNGSGVGRSYDDELIVIDWALAPHLRFYLDSTHENFNDADDEMKATILSTPTDGLSNYHRIGDSREGWAKALELLETMTYEGKSSESLILDFSDVRPAGRPIAGMQNRPASGPISLMRAFMNTKKVVESARSLGMPMWEQALRIDHYFSVEVQVGGARRSARMATKSWHDPDIFDFINIKSKGGLWTANHSVMVDAEFWKEAKLEGSRANSIFNEVTRCSYINGEPGFINGDKLEDHRTGFAWEKPVYTDGRDVRSKKYQADYAVDLLTELSRKASVCRYATTCNPCSEISFHVTGAYCIIADFAPVLACPMDLDEYFYEKGKHPSITHAANTLWDQRIADSVRLAARFLMRVNTMDALYSTEVTRTNRMGVGPTGLHEWAWVRFGLTFNDLVDDPYGKGEPFWSMLDYLSDVAKDESNSYAMELGLNRPATITTIKPSGSVSKLFALTEGAHLPARRQYLRWVQFKGVKDSTGVWEDFSDPLLADYEKRGYPMKELKTFPGMTVVGFPTVPLLLRLGMGDKVVTAPEASPRDQYKWLQLLEKHWIGAEQGNQVSYTLKIDTSIHSLDDFRAIVLNEQPKIRCCSILPSKPDHELGYEYTPEESVSMEEFEKIVAGIDNNSVIEDIDLEALKCASGVCPI